MRVGIIGAGPGGLATACLLKARGMDVEVFEARGGPGGRNSEHILRDGDGAEYKFDTGPTFLLMPDLLKEIFEKCSSDVKAYLDLIELDPLYSLNFADGSQLSPSSSEERTSEQIAKFSYRDSKRFSDYRKHQKKKYAALFSNFRRGFRGPEDLMSAKFLASLPHLFGKSIYDELAEYFEDERVRLAFAFQANFLGMSPFDCPSALSLLSHTEREQGVWHPVGGCNRISLALAKLFTDMGGHIQYNTPVREVVVRGRRVNAFVLENHTHIYFDAAVMNADFAHGMRSLVAEEDRRSFSNERIENLELSCSSFMLYLGLDKIFDLPMHSLYFAQNYRKNIRELYSGSLSADPSFYIHNPSALDTTRAPRGRSAMYIFVPVPNLASPIDWPSVSATYRAELLQKIAQRSGIELQKHIVCERVVTPLNWQNDYRVDKGAIFSLSQRRDQILFMRPQNKFRDFENLYLAGGATHPGTGLPAILQSALISSDLVAKDATLTGNKSFATLRYPLRQKMNDTIAGALKTAAELRGQ